MSPRWSEPLRKLSRYLRRHPTRVAVVVLAGILMGTASFYVLQVNLALEAVATEEFDPVDAREAMGEESTRNIVFVEPIDTGEEEDPLAAQLELASAFDLSGGFDARELTPHSFGEPLDDAMFEAYLLVGTDASGALADAIILALQPSWQSTPVMVSLPRDLYVWNVCKGTLTRLNEGLAGCSGQASGLELLAVMVEDYTGIPVDHVARINFDGFARLVDAFGGITVCVDNPTRDAKAKLDLPEPGCQTVDGATALAWVRSRSTEQLIEGEWKQVAGSDYARQTRQQDVLFQLAARAAGFSSPAALDDRLSAMASVVRLDSGWTFGEAVATAWQYRGIKKKDVSRFSIAADNYRTPGGAAVLLPTRFFIDHLSEVVTLPQG